LQNKKGEDNIEEKGDTGWISQISSHFNGHNPVTVERDENTTQKDCLIDRFTFPYTD